MTQDNWQSVLNGSATMGAEPFGATGITGTAQAETISNTRRSDCFNRCNISQTIQEIHLLHTAGHNLEPNAESIVV
jgi:hypothetical protein